jgi:hypothetical protein
MTLYKRRSGSSTHLFKLLETTNVTLKPVSLNLKKIWITPKLTFGQRELLKSEEIPKLGIMKPSTRQLK